MHLMHAPIDMYVVNPACVTGAISEVLSQACFVPLFQQQQQQRELTPCTCTCTLVAVADAHQRQCMQEHQVICV